MDNQESLKKLIKDSAILITGISVLLYVWGAMSEAFSLIVQGIPLEFSPDRTIQDHMLTGGLIALFFYAPAAFLLYVIFKRLNHFTKGKLIEHLLATYNKGFADYGFLYLMCFALSIVLLVPISDFVIRTNGKKMLRVKSITLNPDSKVTSSYEGLYFVSKRGATYVFADKLTREGGTIYLLSESDVREVVFMQSSR